jgi:hypothetical protein
MGKIYKVQKPGLGKNYTSFLSILSKKERIKTITYVFKR